LAYFLASQTVIRCGQGVSLLLALGVGKQMLAALKQSHVAQKLGLRYRSMQSQVRVTQRGEVDIAAQISIAWVD